MEGSLFDRITSGRTGTRMDEDESIRLHLVRMFIARQGSVQALPDYGLPDINDLTLSRAELIHETCAAIQKCIAQYEPRLTGVTVTHLPSTDPASAFTMELRITAMKRGMHGVLTPWDCSLALDGNKVRGRE
jgi:type VI secretion system protein